MSKGKGNKVKHPQRPKIDSYLVEAEHLLRSKRWREVDEMLTPLTDRFPNNVDLWAMLGDARRHLEDIRGLWEVSETMLRLEPQEPDNWFNQANVAIANQMLFTALHYANEYLRQFPDNPRASTIRKDKETLEEGVAVLRRSEYASPGATDLDYMELEQANIAIAVGNFELGEQLSHRTAERSPRLTAPRNNLALTYAMQGKLDEAQALARSVLSDQPDNVHALANLIMILVFQGQQAEAQQIAERLGRLTLSGERLLKQIQALTYLCQDQDIVEHFEQAVASQTREEKSIPPYAMTCHLAAVAYAHLGNMKRAKQLWQEALKVQPGLAIARANLDNLTVPVDQRTKAFPFELRAWIPRRWAEELLQAGERGKQSKAALKMHLTRFLQANPGVERLLPVLWERGDEAGREFVLQIAEAAQLPFLRDMVLSESGTDEERMRASEQATELGLFSPGEFISMFLKGQRQPIMLMNFEITTEGDRTRRSKAIQRIIDTAHAKLKRGDMSGGEALAREGIAQAPNESTFWNFLAASLEAQKRDAEYEAVSRQIVERFPDYFFGRVGMARVLIRHGEIEEARTLLQPLMAKRKFHISEFAALCAAQIEMLIAEKQYEGARQWLNMWEDAEPGNPAIGHFRRKLFLKR